MASEMETRLHRSKLILEKRKSDYRVALMLQDAADEATAFAKEQLHRACDRVERVLFGINFGSFDPVAMGC